MRLLTQADQWIAKTLLKARWSVLGGVRYLDEGLGGKRAYRGAARDGTAFLTGQKPHWTLNWRTETALDFKLISS